MTVILDRVAVYGRAALDYLAAGWSGVLSLPAGSKSPPPSDATGWGAIDSSRTDVQTWIDHRSADNLALRMPPGGLGIDVDAYGDKPGAATLLEHENQSGTLPDNQSASNRISR